MRSFKYIISISLILLLFNLSTSQTTYPGVRAMGMGDANLANADDVSAMLANPACMDLYLGYMYLNLNFGFYLSAGITDLMAFVANHADKLTDTEGLKTLDDKFYDDLYSIDGKWSTVGLVPNVGFMARTLGLTYGFYYYWDMPNKVMLESGVLVPKVFLGSQMDQIFTGSVAKRIVKNVSLGISVKWIDRYTLDNIALGYTETMEFIDRFNESKLSAIDPLLTHKFGPGIDIGSLFHFGALRVALSIQDLFSYVGKEILHQRLNIGMAYKILPLMENKFIEDMTYTFDLKNLAGYGNFFTKVNMGFETKIKNFDVRCGLHQGYPTFGARMHYLFFTLDYLHYTEEMGAYVNDTPLSYHYIQVGANIRF